MEFAEFDIEFLAQKMSENPASPLFARLADLYVDKNQYAEAFTLLEEGIKNFPGYYAGYLVLGKAHLSVKEYSKAQAAFETALQLSPFNQTAISLRQSVPNKPDESIRTTDENYFAPAAAAAVTPVAEAEPVIAFSPEPETTAAETFDAIPAQQFEMTQTIEEVSSSFEEPQPVAMPEIQQYESPVSRPAESTTVSSYDDYFAQHQHRAVSENPMALDDFLSGSVTPEIRMPAAEPEPQKEFFNESYVEPEPVSTPAVEPAHAEPEPVFASPEQAQLFAELTGINEQETPPAAETDFDLLTEKLQGAEKIVPQEQYQPQTPTPKEPEDDKAYETDAVTPTLAEIYASQGEFRAAIQAYEILMFSHPAKGGEFQKRIRELQQQQMEKDGLI